MNRHGSPLISWSWGPYSTECFRPIMTTDSRVYEDMTSAQRFSWAWTPQGRVQGRRSAQRRTRRPFTVTHTPDECQVRQPSAATARAHSSSSPSRPGS